MEKLFMLWYKQNMPLNSKSYKILSIQSYYSDVICMLEITTPITYDNTSKEIVKVTVSLYHLLDTLADKLLKE